MVEDKGFRLAISGKMRSGKDSLYAEIKKKNPDTVNAKFAQPIKNAWQELKVPKDHPRYKELEREFAQFVGTDIIRREIPDHWTSTMAREVESINYFGSNLNTVITDLRFPNELEWCQNNEFITVRLNISEAEQLRRGAQRDRVSHVSETALDHIPYADYDIVVTEDCNLSSEELARVILKAVREPEWYKRGDRMVINSYGAGFVPLGE